MPSRKRNKGRTRKAWAAAPPRVEPTKTCAHGCPSPLNSTQSQMIDSFSEELHSVCTEKQGTPANGLRFMLHIHKKQPHLFQPGDNRALLQKWLVTKGTGDLLKELDEQRPNHGLAFAAEQMILYVENLDHAKDYSPQKCLAKYRGLLEG